MPADPRGEHWLWRLDAAGWLRAAGTELAAARANLGSRRVAVTHARRAAGMALNAVLVALAARESHRDGDELRWGRSYLDHLRALAEADEAAAAPLSAATRAAAARLLAIPVVPAPTLVQLGRGPHSAAEQALASALQIVDDCAALAGPPPSA